MNRLGGVYFLPLFVGHLLKRILHIGRLDDELVLMPINGPLSIVTEEAGAGPIDTPTGVISVSLLRLGYLFKPSDS